MSAPPTEERTGDDVADRVTDLEVRLAYQDRTIAALDEVVRDLVSRVTTLEREVHRLSAAAAPGAASLPGTRI